MSLDEGLTNIAENIVAAYEARSRSTESLFAATHQILEGFQNSFFDTRQEREEINARLRESLSRNESLRKKDFDRMMQGILCAQEERERKVREELNGYLAEQREMIHTLGENLAGFKDALAGGEAQRLKEFQIWIQEVLARQDERKNQVTMELKEFQRQQQELARTLKALLAKGRELRIKDLKVMLGEFQCRRQDRHAGQEDRRQGVRDRLDDHLKARSAGTVNWQEMQKKLTRARAGLSLER